MITAVIPAYNEPPQLLLETVMSVLAVVQRFDGDVVVVDDGSQTPVKLPDLPRLTLLGHADGGNHGCAAAMNLGIAASRNSTVARCDAGDVWYLEPKSQQLDDFFSSGSAASFSISYDALGGKEWVVPERWASRVAVENVFQASSTVFSKNAWLHAGKYDASMRYVDDWDFAARMEWAVGWRFFPVCTGTANCHPHGQTVAIENDVTKSDQRNRERIKTRRMALGITPRPRRLG